MALVFCAGLEPMLTNVSVENSLGNGEPAIYAEDSISWKDDSDIPSDFDLSQQYQITPK